MQPLLGLPRLRKGPPQLIDERAIGIESSLLPEVAERAAVARPAGVGVFLACQQSQEGGLPGSVRPDKTHPLARPDHYREVLEYVEATERLGHAVSKEHD